MSESICGTVDRVYFASPKFSAGVLKTQTGNDVRFRGPFCANVGDLVTLVGRWKDDPKYGQQFVVQNLSYELPDSTEGLVQYLAKHPAFVGIGEATARKIVRHAASAEHLDRLIRQDVDELHRQLRIPRATLVSLREAWIAHSAENEVRTYLAQFGLTPHQTDTLLSTFGHAVVGVLRADPYQLIRYVAGYGFKKVDKIARALGTPKDHAGRIEAGLLYLVQEEFSSGHTWIAGADLLDKANTLLLLDTLDSRDVIRRTGERLLEQQQLVADGTAVTTADMLVVEQEIARTFHRHGHDERPVSIPLTWMDGLKAKQADAFRLVLQHAIVTISGGAGVGKSHLLARLAGAFREADYNVALCSPTGKAAQRIEELVRKQGLELEAKTLHRLLGYDGHEFHMERVDCDVLFLDEVGFVDVRLMAELLKRVDFTRTRLVLFGDHNQLPPVGPGNVLRDIIQHNLVPRIVLDEVVRQAGVLKANSTAVLSRVIAPSAANDPAWTVMDFFIEAQDIQVYVRDLVLEKLPRHLGLDPLRDVQIITPTHLGPLGTKAINGMMQRVLHGEVARKFTVGDKVVQTVNNYDLGVMNGTIGRVTGIEPGVGGYDVEFDGIGNRLVKDDAIHDLQLAYCITCHRAQGSEFPCAVVLCHRSHFFADRNWLYTAVTRASRYCFLLGDRWGLRNVVRKNHTEQRRTFLSLWAQRAAQPSLTSLEASA